MQADKNTSIFLKSYDRSKWEKVRLGDICSVTTGKLDANAMHPYGKYAFFTCAKEVYKINNYAFDTEALLISGNGSHVGYVHYYKGKFNAYQRTYVLDNFSVNIIFIKHLLDNKLAKRINIEKKSGNTPYILRNTLCDMEILKPVSTDEQFAIVDALQCVDSCISNLEKLISKQENIKKSTEKMLLTPKPGWKKFLLGDICDVSGAGVDKKIRPNEERVILLNYLDVYHKTYVHKSGLDHVVSAKAKQKNRCSVRKNDIFFTPSSETPDDIAKSCVAMEDMPDVAYSYHIIRARPKIPCNSLFVKYACSTHDFFAQAETACVGSGKRYVISLPKFREFAIFVPEIAEQNIIAKSLYDMDMQIELLKQQLAKAQKVKQGLMSYFFG